MLLAAGAVVAVATAAEFAFPPVVGAGVLKGVSEPIGTAVEALL
jgi:hypothetical protein